MMDLATYILPVVSVQRDSCVCCDVRIADCEDGVGTACVPQASPGDLKHHDDYGNRDVLCPQIFGRLIRETGVSSK
jgi:hypothetical protein